MKESMKKHSYRAIVAAILAMIMVFSLIPCTFAGESDETTILACSDFQNESGSLAGRNTVEEILSAMQDDGIEPADGFFACGDYDYDFTDTKGGINMLKHAVSDMVKGDMIFVQGNHDSAVATNGLSQSGKHDPAHQKYGVFVINEDDYMWYNDDEDTIKRTAQNLTEYLNEKLEAGYEKPIFVLSHLGLHYNMRTKNEGFAKYARHIFKVLNEAGQKGLNLFFLFGHNHSNGWDDYLGGASVYLEKGDSILVADRSTVRYSEQTLAFTYFNAGYTGYYRNENGADDTLTMTYITIKDNAVTVTRYSENGVHYLKSDGVRNSYKGEGPYSPNPDVYESPRTVALTAISDKTPLADLLPTDRTQSAYRKVASANDLRDGGKYLLFYNASPDRLMLPEVVTKANAEGSQRIGFEVEETNASSGEVIYGDYKAAEWTLWKADGGWYLGTDEGKVTYRKTDTYAVTATLEEPGNIFTFKGEKDAFTVESGIYSFNYNARSLINFFTSDPAHFYVYEYVGHAVTAEGGKVTDASGKSASHATSGATLTVTASPAPEGYRFAGWETSLSLSDKTSATLSFVMPEEAVSLKAVYEKVAPDTNAPVTTDTPVTDTPVTEPSDGGEDGGSAIVWIVIAAVLVLGGAAVTVVILKKHGK